jgi:hypothetical protein
VQSKYTVGVAHDRSLSSSVDRPPRRAESWDIRSSNQWNILAPTMRLFQFEAIAI